MTWGWSVGNSPVTLDLSKSQPLDNAPVTLDLSKSQPLDGTAPPAEQLSPELPLLTGPLAGLRVSQLTAMLPSAAAVGGGILGSTIPVVGTTLGSAAGGYVGSAAEQLANKAMGLPSYTSAADFAREAEKQALYQGAAGAAGHVLGYGAGVVSNLLQDPVRAAAASRLANSALGTPKTMLTRGFDPGAELARQDISALARGGMVMDPVTGKSAPSLGLFDKVDSFITKTGSDLHTQLTTPQAMAQRINVEDVITRQALDSIKAAETAGNDSAAQAISKRAEALIKNNRLAGTTLNPEDAHALKIDINKDINWSPATEDDIRVNNFMQDTYRALNDAIDTAVPGVKEIQRVYGNMLRAREALEGTITGRWGKEAIPISGPAGLVERLVPTGAKTWLAKTLFPYPAP